MRKATDELRKTHALVETVLEKFDVKSERFVGIAQTLRRTLRAHAWLQDEILVPVLRVKLFGENPFIREMTRDHVELDRLLTALIDTAPTGAERESQAAHIKTLLAAHFKKESAALYPRAELAIDPQTLHKLAEEMENRKSEMRGIV